MKVKKTQPTIDLEGGGYRIRNFVIRHPERDTERITMKEAVEIFLNPRRSHRYGFTTAAMRVISENFHRAEQLPQYVLLPRAVAKMESLSEVLRKDWYWNLTLKEARCDRTYLQRESGVPYDIYRGTRKGGVTLAERSTFEEK